jgi:putative PIN family toxin of toxin-antitoxin system
VSLRLVLDTSVMVAALRGTRGASRALLARALAGNFVLLMSVPLMMEYEAVLTRAEHLAAAGASPADVEAILDGLASVIEPVRLAYLWRPMLTDAQDDMVLETAVNGRADWLVTLNLRHFEQRALLFGVEVLSPGQALARLRRSQ